MKSDRILFSILAALLTAVALPPFYFKPAAFCAFSLLFFALKNTSKSQSALYGCLFGVFITIFALNGISLYGAVIFGGAAAIFAVSGAIYGLIAYSAVKKRGIVGAFSAAGGWCVLEYIRSLGAWAFPTNYALCFADWPLMIQISSFAGIYGVSFFLVAVNFMIFDITDRYLQKQTLKKAATMCSVFVVLYIGFNIALPVPEKNENSFNVGIVQGSVPIWLYEVDKWSYDYMKISHGIYWALSANAGNTDILFWPETAIKKFVMLQNEYSGKIEHICRKNHCGMILGTPHKEGNYEYNAAFSLDRDGEELGRYYKNRLVPVTENIYRKGEGFEPMETAEGLCGVNICFESVFSLPSRRFCEKNAEFLAVITNDAGFRKTAIGDLHAAYSVFRAVENRRYLVRAAQSGISMIVSPAGKILAKTRKFDQTVLKGNIVPMKKLSIYTKYGDWFVAVLFTGLAMLYLRRSIVFMLVVLFVSFSAQAVNVNDCIEAARQSSAELVHYTGNVEKYRARVFDVKKSFHPKVVFNLLQEDTDYNKKYAPESRELSYRSRISVEQVLFSDLVQQKTLLNARDEFRAARYDEESYLSQLASDVRKSYLEILKKKSILREIEKLSISTQKLMESLEKSYTQKSITRIEYLDAKVFANEIEYKKKKSVDEYQYAVDYIEQYFSTAPLSISYSTEWDNYEEDAKRFFQEGTVEQFVFMAMSQRKDLMSERIRNQIKDREQFNAMPHPNVLLNANYDRKGKEFPLEDEEWKVELVAEVPISHHKLNFKTNRTKLKRDVVTGTLPDEAGSQKEISFTLFENGTSREDRQTSINSRDYTEGNLKLLERNIALEVKNSLSSLKIKHDYTESLRDNLRLYEEKIDLMKQQYSAGKIKLSDVLEEEIKFFENFSSYYDSLYETRKSVVEFKTSMGIY